MQIAIEFNLMSGAYLRAWLSSSQQAIDGQIEHSEIARSSLNLQLAPNRPHVFGPKQWLRPCQFAPITEFAARSLRDRILRVLHGRAPLLQRTTSLYPPALWSIRSHLVTLGN